MWKRLIVFIAICLALFNWTSLLLCSTRIAMVLDCFRKIKKNWGIKVNFWFKNVSIPILFIYLFYESRVCANFLCSYKVCLLLYVYAHIIDWNMELLWNCNRQIEWKVLWVNYDYFLLYQWKLIYKFYELINFWD